MTHIVLLWYTELKKLETEQNDGRAEIQSLNTQTGTQHSRTRKGEVSHVAVEPLIAMH